MQSGASAWPLARAAACSEPAYCGGLFGVAVLALHAQAGLVRVPALAPVIDVALGAVGGLAGRGIDEHDLPVGQRLFGVALLAVALVAGGGDGGALDAAAGLRVICVAWPVWQAAQVMSFGSAPSLMCSVSR